MRCCIFGGEGSASSCKAPTHGGEGVLITEMPQGEVVLAALLGQRENGLLLWVRQPERSPGRPDMCG